MPQNAPGGILATIALGVIGAFVGGYLATMLGIGSVRGLDLVSVGIATGGALLTLGIYGYFARGR